MQIEGNSGQPTVRAEDSSNCFSRKKLGAGVFVLIFISLVATILSTQGFGKFDDNNDTKPSIIPAPPTQTPAPTPSSTPAQTGACDGTPSASVCNRNSPLPSFTCPAVAVGTCDATVHASSTWEFDSDVARIKGPNWDASVVSSSVPYYAKALRRSSLDPCELVPTYDEVWTDGICLEDSWRWRPFIDTFLTLMGMEFNFRLYALEMGGPEENYARVSCDLKSWSNDYRTTGGWDGYGSIHNKELTRAKNGEGVQIIDIQAYLCSASDDLTSTQYRWENIAQTSTDLGPSGQCQMYPGARYTVLDYEVPGGYDSPTSSGIYMFTPGGGYGSEFVHDHEMLHMAQYAHKGRRLFMEHPKDGECCTLWFEHISYVTYSGYIERLPHRFEGLELIAPWHGWRVDTQMEGAGGFGSGKLYPSFMALTYPSLQSADALLQKFHTATFVQSAYRLYTAVKDDSGGYRNHLLLTTNCDGDDCAQYDDPNVVYEALSEADKAHYNTPEEDRYQIIFDVTYRLRNLASNYFVYKANQVQQPEGFGAYEFFTYEIQSPRIPFGGADQGSDSEMFALAGFANRDAFLEDFHAWMVANLGGERTPLEVAEEITQSQAGLLQDIERLKERSKIDDSDGTLPRCGDESMPVINFGQ